MIFKKPGFQTHFIVQYSDDIQNLNCTIEKWHLKPSCTEVCKDRVRLKTSQQNRKVDNFYVSTKVPHYARVTYIKVLCDNYYDLANKLKLRQ